MGRVKGQLSFPGSCLLSEVLRWPATLTAVCCGEPSHVLLAEQAQHEETGIPQADPGPSIPWRVEGQKLLPPEGRRRNENVGRGILE